MTDLKALEAAARAATPGPWERLEGVVEVGHPIYKPRTIVTRIVQKRAPDETAFNKVALVDTGAANAAFIALANPSAILSLLSDLAALAAENERMRKGLTEIKRDIEDGIQALARRDGGAGEAFMTGIQLEGRQGEPAGMMTVKVTMSDGSERVLIQDNGNVISHWKNLDGLHPAPASASGDGGRPFGLSPMETARVKAALLEALGDAYTAGFMADQGFDASGRADLALAALRTTPADPRPDPRDEALREAREAIVSANADLDHGGDKHITRAGETLDQALAKINAVIGGDT